MSKRPLYQRPLAKEDRLRMYGELCYKFRCEYLTHIDDVQYCKLGDISKYVTDRCPFILEHTLEVQR